MIIGYFVNSYYSIKVIGSVGFYVVKTLLKVSILVILEVLIVIVTANLFQLEINKRFFTIPILLFSYLIGLSLLNLVDFRIKIKSILNLY